MDLFPGDLTIANGFLEIYASQHFCASELSRFNVFMPSWIAVKILTVIQGLRMNWVQRFELLLGIIFAEHKIH